MVRSLSSNTSSLFQNKTDSQLSKGIIHPKTLFQASDSSENSKHISKICICTIRDSYSKADYHFSI